MISIISPAKSMDFSPISDDVISTKIATSEQVEMIINELNIIPSQEIKKLMKVSDKIAQLNSISLEYMCALYFHCREYVSPYEIALW